MEVVKYMGFTEGLLGRWARDRHHMLGGKSCNGRIATMTSIIRFLRLSTQSLILGLGAYLVIERAATIGSIFAASVLLTRALQPIDQIVGSWRGFNKHRPMKGR
jgi:ATP-binding cassette, subfamily C, bacterial